MLDLSAMDRSTTGSFVFVTHGTVKSDRPNRLVMVRHELKQQARQEPTVLATAFQETVEKEDTERAALISCGDSLSSLPGQAVFRCPPKP